MIDELEKKLKTIQEQIVFFRAENRLFINYLRWYQQRILELDENDPTAFVYSSSNDLHRQAQLSIQKKREIAETTCKVLLSYKQKSANLAADFIDQCHDTIETNEETIVHLQLELTILRKFIEKIDKEIRDKSMIFTSEKLFEFFHERIRYRETLAERKRQKSLRLRFHLENVEKSIRKVRQISDEINQVDFDHLKIDIEKQMKELNKKNEMLIFFKRQQSDANVQLNMKKPELFEQIRSLKLIRDEIHHRIEQLHHCNDLKERMSNEIVEYERTNEPIRTQIFTYRVPSIIDYVNLKSQQVQLHHQIEIWQRKIELVQRDLHQRQYDLVLHPEKIYHPWKSIHNPSPILFDRSCRKNRPVFCSEPSGT